MPAALPLDLPRLVMRRAAWVGAAVLLLALVLGLQRIELDIDEEVDAAMHLATLMSRLGTLAPLDDASALAALQAMQLEAPLRHLALHIHNAEGRTLLEPVPQDDPRWLAMLLEAHRLLMPEPDQRRVSWVVARPQGPAWIVSLDSSRDSEQREALASLAGMMAMLLLAVAGVLGAMHFNVRRALAPLATLVGAMAGIERQGTQAVARLPAMPVRELEAIAVALRHLAGALDEAEGRRRLLSQKVLTLQEDERHHLARELHDELGQRLTALRLDAAWLTRRLGPDPAGSVADMAEVVQGMAQRCAELQRDVRQLLVQLDPLGPGPVAASDGAAAPLALARLHQLLADLVQGWQATPVPAPGGGNLRVVLDVGQGGQDGALPCPPPPPAETVLLPRALLLAIYRLSQEALTNAARHANAHELRLSLRLLSAEEPQVGEASGHSPTWQLVWEVSDDGIGIADPARAMQRGNGLGGMQERVWALGGQWLSTAARAHAGPGQPPGLRLQARLPVPPPGALRPEPPPAPPPAPTSPSSTAHA